MTFCRGDKCFVNGFFLRELSKAVVFGQPLFSCGSVHQPPNRAWWFTALKRIQVNIVCVFCFDRASSQSCPCLDVGVVCVTRRDLKETCSSRVGEDTMRFCCVLHFPPFVPAVPQHIYAVLSCFERAKILTNNRKIIVHNYVYCRK